MTTRPKVALRWLAGVPLAVLTGGYLWLARDHGTPWVLGAVVHEGGRYTLAETILYGRHLLRELPIAGLYAAASVAAVAAFGPRPTRAPSRTLRAAALAGAVALVAGVWLTTVRAWGADVAWLELRQSYLRDEDDPVPGVHWAHHLLSTCVYVAAAVGLAAGVQGLLEGAGRAPRAREGRALGAVVAAILVMTALCGGAAAFVDARHLGHQAREATTHLVLTLPASFALLLVAGGWGAGSAPDATARRSSRAVGIVLGAGGLLLAYLVLGALATGAAHAARPGARLSSLVGAHWYEHGLDYVLVLLLATAFAPAVNTGAPPG